MRAPPRQRLITSYCDIPGLRLYSLRLYSLPQTL